MNAHVHPAFGGLLSAIGGAPVSPERRIADELKRAQERIAELEAINRELMPEVIVYKDAGTPSETYYQFPEHVVLEALPIFFDRHMDLLEDICKEVEKSQEVD